MADNTPLNEAEQKQFDALQAKRAAAQAAVDETARDKQRASLEPIDGLLKMVCTDKVDKAIEEILEHPAIAFETKQKIQNFKVALNVFLLPLAESLALIRAPTIKIPAL